MGIWARRFLALPAVLVSYLVAAVIRAAWGSSLTWVDGVMVVRLAPSSWMNRTWGEKWAGVTLGHSIVLAHDASRGTLKHELAHVEQIESNAVAGLALGMGVLPWSMFGFFVIWSITPLIAYLASFLVAKLRGEDPYMGSFYEEAASDSARKPE